MLLSVKDPGVRCAIQVKKKKCLELCVCMCVYVCEVDNGIVRMGITTHSSILAWKIPWTEEPGGL